MRPPGLPSQLPRMGGWTLRLAFAGIVGTFLLASALGIYRASVSQSENRHTVERMLASVELVSRLGTDVDQKRLLIDAHIFQKEAVDMARIEERIARVDADFAATERAFEPFATGNGERVVWDDLRNQTAAMQAPIEKALALSRVNRDEEARAVLVELEGGFDAIARDATTLVRINRADADEEMAKVRAAQRESLLFGGIITAAGVALSLLVAALVTRSIQRREDQLRESTALLEQRNRELDAFAGRVAHDLRGPLTTINVAASRLAERAPQEEGTSAVLRRGVSRMEMLIRDLLALSRIDAEADDVTADPAVAAASVAEELGPRVRAEGGSLRVAVRPACVRCNEGLLRQVLWNLIDNAIKYRRSDAPPDIEVRGQSQATWYELRVADQGMGLSHEDARHVFEPFFRALQSREAPGTGLGLSIVKRVVEVHGGSVTVDSRLGQGTTFTIRLPLRARPREAPRGHGVIADAGAWRERLRRA